MIRRSLGVFAELPVGRPEASAAVDEGALRLLPGDVEAADLEALRPQLSPLIATGGDEVLIRAVGYLRAVDEEARDLMRVGEGEAGQGNRGVDPSLNRHRALRQLVLWHQPEVEPVARIFPPQPRQFSYSPRVRGQRNVVRHLDSFVAGFFDTEPEDTPREAVVVNRGLAQRLPRSVEVLVALEADARARRIGRDVARPAALLPRLPDLKIVCSEDFLHLRDELLSRQMVILIDEAVDLRQCLLQGPELSPTGIAEQERRSDGTNDDRRGPEEDEPPRSLRSRPRVRTRRPR